MGMLSGLLKMSLLKRLFRAFTGGRSGSSARRY